MKNLVATLCLTISVLLGSVGVSSAADYQTGLDAGQTGDFATALREWRPLAEQGDAEAQYNLGIMYDSGTGVAQDDVEAVRLHRLAAEQGEAFAQFNLGVMYYLGQGVIQDNVYAHMWFNIAASTGGEDAVSNRDIAASRMTLAQIAEAQALARECVQKNYKGC